MKTIQTDILNRRSNQWITKLYANLPRNLVGWIWRFRMSVTFINSSQLSCSIWSLLLCHILNAATWRIA